MLQVTITATISDGDLNFIIWSTGPILRSKRHHPKCTQITKMMSD